MLCLSSEVAVLFEDKVTPQSLIDALRSHYMPDQQQEIERLETELSNLNYNGEDPVIWTASVKGLVAKLTHRQAKPQDRTIKSAVLKALATEPEYKIGVEVIKQTQPNITLDDLWTTVGRFTYPIKSEESLFMAKNRLTSTKSEMIALGRKFSNRHGDYNDDRRCKPEHSERYEKLQRPE